MKSAIAKKWVSALRSGKYEQAQGVLKDASGAYCCLGVLQECVLGLPTNLKAQSLSSKAQEAAGMHSASGDQIEAVSILMGPGGTQASFPDLASANDDGMSFSAIADWIEDNHASL